VLVSSTLVFAAEWLVADGLAGVDLLRPGASAPDLDTTTVLVVYAVGVFVSLPLSFVPPAALFGGRGFAASFGESVSAFARNPAAFMLSGVFALALIVLGLLTVVGLAIALPLIQCATYAAWRDLAPGAPGATPSEPGRSA
jgi:uncharacterized membrane protein